ncbi:hypothetical protein ANN_24665 [Periplaneta americana]|uniref:Small ribosomal subunit protein uS13 n=1 Tax=Periplaneta americana TaxID=6978 RepID=A0ABQ8S3Z2_PERAM|nr:hypothetical protein ANN_24665 [Periplaneta americana]
MGGEWVSSSSSSSEFEEDIENALVDADYKFITIDVFDYSRIGYSVFRISPVRWTTMTSRCSGIGTKLLEGSMLSWRLYSLMATDGDCHHLCKLMAPEHRDAIGLLTGKIRMQSKDNEENVTEAGNPILSQKSLVIPDKFQHILRVMGTNIDGKRKVMFAMTAIKGVGRRYANIVLKKADIDLDKRAGECTDEEQLQYLIIHSVPVKSVALQPMKVPHPHAEAEMNDHPTRMEVSCR